jgi:DNA-binding winged helix-turn-helix (wHTH) protein
VRRSPGGVYAFGSFCLHADEHLVTCEGVAIPLPPKCIDLLALLVQSGGHLVEKHDLIQTLWPDTFVEEANVSNLVGLLRKALGDSRGVPQYIQTVPKRGYRFIASVTEVEQRAGSKSGAPQRESWQPAIRIIAFPFRIDPNLGEWEYLAYSLPEAIASTLAELNAFTVRSIQVAMQFDQRRWDPQSVAVEAHVDVILTGTLDLAGGRLRSTTQLLDAPSGTVLWSKTWDIDPQDVFRLQTSIVQLVVHSLVRSTRPASGPTVGVAGKLPSDPAAYELYLRANHLTLTRTPDGMALARDLYVACVEQDPSYAPAWARLGRCYRFLRKFNRDTSGDADAAEAAFQRAFALNPDLGIAHSLYTQLQADFGHADEAMVRLLRRAERHDNDPEPFTGLVQACRYCGLLSASIRAHETALRLDPNAHTSVAHTYFMMCDYEKSLYWYGKAGGAGLYLDAMAMLCMGRREEASALVWARQDRFYWQPGLMNSLLAYLNGDLERGIAAVRDNAASDFRDPETSFYLARQAAKLGALDLAIELLQRSVEQGFCVPTTIIEDAWLAPLRRTPEFERTLAEARTRERQARTMFVGAGGDRICAAPP